MKISRIAKQYEKHPRETKDFITLYHVSKDRITKFQPKSNFKGHMGCYFSPSYRSAITDWADVIKGRKQDNHPAQVRIDEIKRELDKTTDETAKDALYDELQVRYKSLLGEEEAGNNFYKTLYVHKVSLPKATYKQCLEWFYSFQKREKEETGTFNIGFWAWGAQVFIPSEFLNQVQILSVTELSQGDFVDEYKNITRRKPHYPDSLYPKNPV